MKKLALFIVLIIFISLPLVGDAKPQKIKDPKELIGSVTIKVTYVIDGDTIRADIEPGFDIILQNQRVRLHGIDAPEIKKDKEAALKAQKRLKWYLVDTAKEVRMVKLPTKDKYGRWVGRLYVKNEKGEWIDVNESLIDDGVVKLYIPKPRK
ncbi:MAG: thermonuclease family protein [Patescibacteria group bacterium]|nr:thermonuclease family protein [Patescibacteria group bacterium]MDD5490461.1 thermonuclease family protein [Patescibacteria group bacterium]